MANHLSPESSVKTNTMDDKETTTPNSSLESDELRDFPSKSEPDGRTKAIVNREENLVKKMNQDIHEITEKICEKMSERDHLGSVLKRLNYPHQTWRNRLAQKEKILRDLNMALDELCFMNKASNGRANKIWFREKHKNISLNSMMLHGSKSLAEENQILRDINIQERHAASFQSLEVLKKTVRWNPCLNNWQKILREIDQFQIQWEKAVGNASVKGKFPNYESLKKDVKDQIKLLCDDCLEDRRQLMACRTNIRRAEKELGAINRVLFILKAKLTEKHTKKGEAYHRILKLKKLYDGEV